MEGKNILGAVALVVGLVGSAEADAAGHSGSDHKTETSQAVTQGEVGAYDSYIVPTPYIEPTDQYQEPVSNPPHSAKK